MEKSVENVYGNRVRVRACGVCVEDGKLLMVNHTGVTSTHFWCPPGGGVEFGATIGQTIARELEEETGLKVTPGTFLFGCEFIQKPIHSIELFYEAHVTGGQLRTGRDPEIQIIRDARFMTFKEVKSMPTGEVHGIFRTVHTLEALLGLRGFYTL